MQKLWIFQVLVENCLPKMIERGMIVDWIAKIHNEENSARGSGL